MIRDIEELSMNAFPALSTILVNGWVLRFSEGYARRANSVNPIYPCRIDILRNIEICEDMYSSRGLNTIFKLTEDEEAYKIDEMLQQREYSLEAKTNVMLKDIRGFRIDSDDRKNVMIYREFKDSWFEAFIAMNKVGEQNAGILRKMLQGILADTYYACIVENGKVIAVGQGVAERGYIGMFDICVHEEYRRKGLGTKLMINLMHAAAAEKSEYSYLQVVDDNELAKQLYDKLGYRKQYSYWYRVKKLKR